MLSFQILKAQVTADFFIPADSGCAPFVARFADSSTGPIIFRRWEFGNGNIATGNNTTPAAIYNTPGIYNVTLTVSDGVDTASVTKVGFIHVLSLPTANFNTQNILTGCANFDFQVVNTSTSGTLPITSWNWDFDDGSPLVPGVGVTHTYYNPGSFAVTLIVSDSMGCSSSKVRPNLVQVLAKPKANFYSNDSLSVCGPPLTVVINNSSVSSSPLTYNWLVGGVSYNTNNVMPTFTSSGGYDAQLIVTNAIGCTDTIIKPNYIWIGAILADMNIVNTACLGASTEMINSSFGGNTFTWDFGDGNSAIGDTVHHTYATDGLFNVTLVASSGSNCDDSLTQSIFVESVQADFTSTPHFSCSVPFPVDFTDQSIGNIVKWEWHFGDLLGKVPHLKPNISFAQNPTVLYADTGSFDDTLIVTSANGCKDMFIIPDNEQVIMTPAYFTPSKNDGCVPLEVDFTNKTEPATRVASWYWDYGDGSPLDFNYSPTHTFTNIGIFNVELTIVTIMGCTNSYFSEIRVGNLQTADFSINTNIACGSDTVFFNNLSFDPNIIDAYTWHFGDGETMGGFDAFHVYKDTGYMEVTLIAEFNGCEDTLTIDSAIFINGPISYFNPIFNCDTQNVVRFNPISFGGTNFLWDFGDATSLYTTNTEVEHVYLPQDSAYEVILNVSDPITGCTATVSQWVRVRYLNAVLTAGDTTVCKGQNVIFSTNSSTNALAYVLWSKNTMNSPTIDNSMYDYTFNQKGPHTIYAVCMDEHSCLDTAQQSVYVYEPVINYTSIPSVGCAPLSVQFSDFSTSDTTIVNWDWNFGNGSTSNLQNPLVVYNGIGTTNYDISLTVTDTFGCFLIKDSISAITVREPPSYFSTANTQVCAGSGVLFGNQPLGPYGYLWDFGDGGTSTLANPTHVFTDGFFDISLTVIDQFGCDSTYVRPSYMNVQRTPEANFTATPRVTNCYPASIIFVDSSSYPSVDFWTWNFGDSPNDVVVYGVAAQNFYNYPGMYDVTMVITTPFGCADTIVKYNFVTIGGPTGSITHQPNIGCVGDDMIFEVANTNSDAERFIWDFGDGIVDTSFAPNESIKHVYHNKGFYLVSMLLSDSQGLCTKTDTTTIEVDFVSAQFELSDTVSCTPLLFGGVNTSIGNDISNWYINSNSVSTDSTYNFEISIPGTHDITLVVSNAYSLCRDTLIQKVVVNPLPVLNISPDATICVEDSLVLWAKGAKDYHWSPSTWLSDTSVSSPIATPFDDISYALVGVDSNGCINFDSVNISVIQKPILTFITPDTSIHLGTELYINTEANAPLVYAWSPDIYLGCTQCPEPLVKPKVSTLYTLVYTDSNNCFVMDTTVYVEVKDEFHVYIPNAFTPGKDQLNDTFIPVIYGVEELVFMRIFDRWGTMVYETFDITQGWDGRVNGEIAAHNSAFSYKMQVRKYTGDLKIYVGMFVLISTP